MDLLAQTKYLLKKTGLKPDKLRGQNFCIDKNIIDEMIKTAQVSKEDHVLEVGPGFGFLTLELIKQAKEVVAVELDEKLIKPLKQLEKANKNLEVIQGNILDFNLTTKNFLDYKIVANLPYSITSVFLKKFLTIPQKPKSMTLLVQKEVAERICAKAGEMSKLSVSVQLYGLPKMITDVKPSSFWPEPAVNSTILQINDIHSYQFANQVSEKFFWRVVKSGFSAKHKQLHNNLKNSLHLKEKEIDKIFSLTGLDIKIRAQELEIADWVKLSKTYEEVHIDA